MPGINFRFLSWNLKDFGNYDYSGTMSRIAKTILDDGADVFAIMEVAVNRRVKRAGIDDDLVLVGAETALEDLLNELNKQDKVSNWENVTTGVNAGNKDRDAYSFFWKSTPVGTTKAPFFPIEIELKKGPFILRQDDAGKELKFGNSRKPGACLFEFYNPKASPKRSQSWVVAFHACANFDKPKDIQNALKDCLSAAEAQSGTLPYVIGTDTNLDYTTNKTYFTNLEKTYTCTVGVTDGEGSSLLGSVDKSGTTPKVADNAYDNLISKRINQAPAIKPRVVNVINNMAKERQAKPPKGKKRKLEEDVEDAFSTYITKNVGPASKKAKKTPGISDHLPVAGTYEFK